MIQKHAIVVVVVLLAVGLAPGLAAADDHNATQTPNKTILTPSDGSDDRQEVTATPTSTPTPTATEQAAPEPTETPSASTPDTDDNETEAYLGEIGESGVYVVNAVWEDGQLASLVVENSAPSGVTVTVTDASIDIQAHETVDIPQDSTRIGPGRSELSFRQVTRPNHAAVTVGTSRGGLRGLSPDDRMTFFPATPAWQDVWFAGLGGGAAGLGAVLLIGWIQVSVREDDHEEVL